MIYAYSPISVPIDDKPVKCAPFIKLSVIGSPTFWMGIALRENGQPAGHFVAFHENERAWIPEHECPRKLISGMDKGEFEYLHDEDAPSIDQIEKELVKMSRQAQREWREAVSLGRDATGHKRILDRYNDMISGIRFSRAWHSSTKWARTPV